MYFRKPYFSCVAMLLIPEQPRLHGQQGFNARPAAYATRIFINARSGVQAYVVTAA
jgi:hypothetical protein